MNFGVFLPSFIIPGRERSHPADVRRFARSAEALGFDSLWITDHIITAHRFYSISWLDSLMTLSHVAAVTEPLWSKVKDKYRVLITGAEALPPLDNVVGMTTGEAAKTRGDFIRAVIRARRRAVEFMIKNPDEAGDIVAKDFNITPEVARAAVRNLTTSYTQGIPYWGNGQIHLEGMKRIIEVQRSVGALTGEVDLAKIIDTQFLPEDIRKPVAGK